MSIKISKLREIGYKINRKGMSVLALDCVNKFDGSYKGVIELAGKLSVIAKMTTCDEYWLEQTLRGQYSLEVFLEYPLEIIIERINKMESEQS